MFKVAVDEETDTEIFVRLKQADKPETNTNQRPEYYADVHQLQISLSDDNDEGIRNNEETSNLTANKSAFDDVVEFSLVRENIPYVVHH